jgi:hypothetical protein
LPRLPSPITSGNFFGESPSPPRWNYLFNAALQLTTTVSGVEFNCPNP